MERDLNAHLDEFGEMLPLCGWPEWPPQEVPILKKWWHDDKREFNKYGNTSPYTTVIEVIGSPQSGKTTLATHLQTTLMNRFEKQDTRLTVMDEAFFSTRYQPEYVHQLMPAPPDTDITLPIMWEKNDWTTTLMMQFYKNQWMQHYLTNERNAISLAQKHVLVVYRGSIDSTIWYNTTYTHSGDESFEIPDWYKDDAQHNKLWRRMIAQSQLNSGMVDSAILIGTSQEIAQERRQQAGKTKPGWVTDSPVFDDYLAWQGYWVDNVYPNMRNIGLLTVNGENKMKDNLDRVSEYIWEAAQRILPQ